MLILSDATVTASAKYYRRSSLIAPNSLPDSGDSLVLCRIMTPTGLYREPPNSRRKAERLSVGPGALPFITLCGDEDVYSKGVVAISFMFL